MSPIDLFVMAAGFALAPAYICRLDALSFRSHRAEVVCLHLVLFIGCISSGYHAWMGASDLSDFCAVAAAGLWIAVSWPTWRTGVPDYATRPQSLTDDSLRCVAGGRSDDGWRE